LHDSTLSGDTSAGSGDAVRLEDPTFIVGGAIGYNYDSPWRVEGELTYQTYDVDAIKSDDTGVFQSAAGDIDLFALGINGYYDFENDSAFTPYLGAGLGAFYAMANDVQRPGRSTLDDSAFAPMAQGMLGISYALSDNADLTAGYRLQVLPSLSGEQTRTNGTTVGADVDTVLIHSGSIGLRFSF
jgi:OmpA-OmpF porin, OOP family